MVKSQLTAVFASVLACSVAMAFVSPAVADNEAQNAQTTKLLSKRDREALELGRKVLAARTSIQNPEAPNAMKAITDLGWDSRYYVMVRGWLSMQLQGDKSIVDASKVRPLPEVQERIEFLKKAIRAIDLE